MLVDGWNHFLAAERCFGYRSATRFPIDRLAVSLAAETGADAVNDAVVVMALPDRNRPGETNDHSAWRKRLRRLHNYGVRHEKARFSYREVTCSGCGTILDPRVTCERCGASTAVASRRREKGADIALASLALSGAWQEQYDTLVVLSQDTDFAPMIRHVKEAHQRQGRRYALYSAFPVCAHPGHGHRSIPGTRELPIDAARYQTLIDAPGVHVRGQDAAPQPAAIPALPGSTPGTAP